jgi:hypothetical protein
MRRRGVPEPGDRKQCLYLRQGPENKKSSKKEEISWFALLSMKEGGTRPE